MLYRKDGLVSESLNLGNLFIVATFTDLERLTTMKEYLVFVLVSMLFLIYHSTIPAVYLQATQNTSKGSWSNIGKPSMEPDEWTWRRSTSSVLRQSESKLTPLEFRNEISPREVIEHLESRKRSKRQTHSIYPILRQDQCSCSIRANVDDEKVGKETEDTELFLNPLRLEKVEATARDHNVVMSDCKQHSMPSSSRTTYVNCEGSGDGDDQLGEGTSSLNNDLSSSARRDESSVVEEKLLEVSGDSPQLHNRRQNVISVGEKSFQAGVRKWLGQMEQTDEMRPAKSSRRVSPEAMTTALQSSRLGFSEDFTILKDAAVENDLQIEATDQDGPSKEVHKILKLTSRSHPGCHEFNSCYFCHLL